ncbi:hypothetical protein D3C78_1712700 [compost metagenome]
MEDKDLRKVYETLLCSPGMNELVKVDLKITRKTILLLSQVVGKELNEKPGTGERDILGFADKESIAELQGLVAGSLEKASLIALTIKLQEIVSK